jgi:hypothetical protein
MEYLGVIVEPNEIEGHRTGRMQEALYGFDEKCFLTGDTESYGRGAFDIVGYEDFEDYWSSADAEQMFVAGDQQYVVEFFKDLDLESSEIVFENYSIRGSANTPTAKQVLKDEVRALMPFAERKTLVDENTAAQTLDKIGVPEADTKSLGEVADPPERSRYYSKTSV